MDLGKLALGADASVALKIEAGKLIAVFELAIEKELEAMVDKIEAIIPGDQTGIAAAVKVVLESQMK